MITVIKGVANAIGQGQLAFKADRSYDVYALEGYNKDGEAKIALGVTNAGVVTPGTIVTLAQGVTCGGYDRICWSGHLVILEGDFLGMQALAGVALGQLQFEIVLIPITLVKKAEIEASKEWLP
ncbi:unnamed protein product [marine sediment metagenome]|uniref:Uncharacterized protein n=1 Tax=marine sediment metagenome TaxID=412755 RepID=X1JG72_9ZZZZ